MSSLRLLSLRHWRLGDMIHRALFMRDANAGLRLGYCLAPPSRTGFMM